MRVPSKEIEVAICFSDINNYTSFAEALPAQQVIEILDLYFQAMGSIVEDHNGSIIDYVGDGLLAVYGIEGETTCRNCIQAVHAALQMQQAMITINEVIKTIYDRDLSIRIGIHYGKVILGTIGKKNMEKLAIIGDNVNLASRIERLNKELQTDMLISACAYEHISDQYQIKRNYVVNVRGKTGLYKLYEIEKSYLPHKL
jgi:adenylate cyclase